MAISGQRFEIMDAVESRFGYKINIEFIGGRLLQSRAPRQPSEPRSPGASLGTYVCPHHPFGWLAFSIRGVFMIKEIALVDRAEQISTIFKEPAAL
jgi:hypothetical protein